MKAENISKMKTSVINVSQWLATNGGGMANDVKISSPM